SILPGSGDRPHRPPVPDGKADLVERDSAGDLFRNSGDGKGSFGARVKISGGWSGYTGVF
ncbi:hypothetical protein, partial [Streptomyces sp. Agncl-13]|uniref:hypothetical protein n=1 Tax=Streptomyces sp. Agncl-13 TaxID=3400628 RepID=UPI003A8B7E4A